MNLKNYIFKKQPIFHAIHYCLLLVCLNAFSQTEIYKSDFVFIKNQAQELSDSPLVSGNKILFNADTYKIYAVNQDSLKPIWEMYIDSKANRPPYLYKNTFLYENYENETAKVAQYDLNTGVKIKRLPFESINPRPYFVNNIMYCTTLADGEKQMAYNLVESKIIWQKKKDIKLISETDGQLNKLNVEPDHKTAVLIQAKARLQSYLDCTKPDPKMIEAANAAKEKFKNKK
jgi:hypothetical protein